MPEELGKIEKPPVEEFKEGRKIYFVPLVLSSPGMPPEFTEKLGRYWEQVDSQIANLESKLGPVSRLYHELVPETGQEGLDTIQKVNPGGLPVFQSRVDRNAVLEALEDNDLLNEIMDWTRCLSLGLQSQKVFSTVYGLYTEANNKRNESISRKINETLKENESCIVIMGEGHHVKFPSDINIFYIAPPALDELKRWMRDYEGQAEKKATQETEQPEEKTSQTEDQPPLSAR
ncbi:MAG: hypothetical protein PHU23_00855 [Dehalococcoidales bacterium]|nr:hypothetical protein [Dehalococcoidales bacterium]